MIRFLPILAAVMMPELAVANAQLFAAVEAGDQVGVERELANGADVDSRSRDQATLLIAAALANQPAIVELLLDEGADVMARNSGGFTALHAAAYTGNVPIVELLLGKNAVLDDDANKAGVTPLMVAGEQDNLAVAELLIAKGADVNHPEIHGYLPITRALFKGNSDIIRLYKRHGATCQAKIAGWYQKCLEIGD